MKTLRKILIVITALLLSTSTLLATKNPTPFGLEFGVTTVEDVKQMGAVLTGTSTTTSGVVTRTFYYKIKKEKIGNELYDEISLSFNQSGKLINLDIKYSNKADFDEILKQLETKYDYKFGRARDTETMKRANAVIGATVLHLWWTKSKYGEVRISLWYQYIRQI